LRTDPSDIVMHALLDLFSRAGTEIFIIHLTALIIGIPQPKTAAVRFLPSDNGPDSFTTVQLASSYNLWLAMAASSGMLISTLLSSSMNPLTRGNVLCQDLTPNPTLEIYYDTSRFLKLANPHLVGTRSASIGSAVEFSS